MLVVTVIEGSTMVMVGNGGSIMLSLGTLMLGIGNPTAGRGKDGKEMFIFGKEGSEGKLNLGILIGGIVGNEKEGKEGSEGNLGKVTEGTWTGGRVTPTAGIAIPTAIPGTLGILILGNLIEGRLILGNDGNPNLGTAKGRTMGREKEGSGGNAGSLGKLTVGMEILNPGMVGTLMFGMLTLGNGMLGNDGRVNLGIAKGRMRGRSGIGIFIIDSFTNLVP
jgi:hypothetical protein